jgi:hypothetical protein
LAGQALSGTLNGTDQYLTFWIALQWATLSKRVTAINLYARFIQSGVTGSYYFIRRVPIHNLTSTQAAQWTFQAADDPTAGDEKLGGFFSLDGTSDETKTQAVIIGTDWEGKGGTYYERTGRNENQYYTVVHNIINWQYTETLAGRRFFGYFYDQTDGTTITDWIRFTPFGQGIPNYDVIPSDRLNFEFEAASGDPGSVKGLISDKGYLYVFKDSSIRSSYINDNPETWVHNDVSNQDGLYSSKSLVRLPDGGVCFADVDHFKLVYNQRVVSLTDFIKNTYYGLTGKADIISWYDKIDGAVCFTNGVDSTFYTHYRGYKTSEGMAWYKIVLPSPEYPEFVGIDRVGSVIFTNGGVFPGMFKWSRTAYDFAGSRIAPYLKTNVTIPDESAHVLVDKYILTKSGNASAGVLNTRIYLEGTVTQSFVNADKAKKTLYQILGADSVRQGRRIQIEYNYDSDPEYSATEKMQLDGIDVYGQLIQPPEKSV